MNRMQRDIIRMVQEEGLELLDCTRKKHIHLSIRAADGRTTKMIVPTTTSDNARAGRNNRAWLRRFAKNQVAG